MNIDRNTQFQVFTLQIFRNGFFCYTITVVQQFQFQLLSIFLTNAVTSHSPASFIQHLCGCIRIIFIRSQFYIAIRYCFCIQSICRFFQSIENTIRNNLSICGVLQSLSYCCITQNIVGRIQYDMSCRSWFRQRNRKFFTVHILTNGICIQHILTKNQIDFARFQSHDTCLIVWNYFYCYFFNCR